ncbi:MAG: LysM peptidoglycan-binding domain-containing protein [Actinobacteria bacterium]|nr:LysM peptidoglycan-binding domain-containing protein [Actinomycetota bacterium]
MFGKLLIVALLAALAVGLVEARSSSGAGKRQLYVVRPADTLWSIAAEAYGGDPREAIWRIEQANHLVSDDIEPGETIVLPG